MAPQQEVSSLSSSDATPTLVLARAKYNIRPIDKKIDDIAAATIINGRAVMLTTMYAISSGINRHIPVETNKNRREKVGWMRKF